MSEELKNIVTPDDLMEEFVTDMVVADDELSDSIFTCVDNYIDDLCIEMMNDEKSVFETDTDVDTPFIYILDKVMEKVDTIEQIQSDSYLSVINKQFSDPDDDKNTDDPDYCDGVDLSEITPEDFQVYIPKIEHDGDYENHSDEQEASLERYFDYEQTFEDSIFNA